MMIHFQKLRKQEHRWFKPDLLLGLRDKNPIFERFQSKNNLIMKGYSLILKTWLLVFLSVLGGQKVNAQSCVITFSGNPCVGTPVTFTGSSSGSNHQWIFNDGGTDNFTNGPLNVNYAFKNAGKNKVTYITTINGQQCTTSVDIDIFQKPKIDIKITTIDTQCFENNLFCWTDDTKNPNGKKIVNAKYVVGDGQFFEYDFPPSAMPNLFCYSIKDVRGGAFSLYIETTDENGCTDTMNIKDAVYVREKIGAAFSSNRPVKCDSVEAIIRNISRIGKDQVDSIWWFWGDGTSNVGTNPVDDKIWGPTISKWFYGQGVYDSKLVIRTKDGCKDSMEIKATATVFTSKVRILADKDSTCISEPEIRFSVDQVPSGVSGFLWTFGDPNSGPENINFRTWAPAHIFRGLGPFLITLAYNHPICGPALVMDTIIILGPQSVVDVPGDRIADWQIFQCPKDVMDTVYFRNNSTFYHNDLDFTDDDSTFYKDGTTALGHNFQQVNGAWVWIPPRRLDRNENGDSTVYTGSGPLLPGAHNDPFKRERVCATRLWDFGDNFGSKCTTDVLNNKNVNVNCNFSRDTIPFHYYKSWDLIMLSDFKMAPMEDARFIDSNGICIRVPVFPDSIFYIIEDTLVYVPKNFDDSTTYLNSGIKGSVNFGLEKVIKGKGERFLEFYAAVELDDNNTATIIKKGVSTVVTGPWIDTLEPEDIIILNSENDSIKYNYTVYLKQDTLPYNLYKIRAAKGENVRIVDSFKRIPNGIPGYNYIINYERFRSLYYARIPSCNNARLIHEDTCHPLACKSEAIRQVVMMHANAGGVGSGLIKDAIECLGSRNPVYGVTFILSDLKPGCSFTELQINYDTFCGNNWVSLSGLNPGGRPVTPPSPPPYWDGGGNGNPNAGYDEKGNPGSRFSTYYMGKPCNDSTGCVTVGVIVGNGVARPGGSAAQRPLCADTHYYDRFACFPFIDPAFEILNLNKNPNGDYKICKWDPIIARFTEDNFTKVDDLMTLRWMLNTSNAGPYFNRNAASFIQEDIFRYQKMPKPFMLPNGKMSNPNYLYSYIVQTRGYEDPVQTPCKNEWSDGNAIITDGPDTLYTAEIRDFTLAADVSKVWDRIREILRANGFDPFALGDTTIAKMIWNSVGEIGKPSTGAYGCLDTAGFGKDIRYYYIPNRDSMTVFHYRDSTITPLDTHDVFGTKFNSYRFVPTHAGRYILSVSMRSANGQCDDIKAEPLIVGFAMFTDLFTDSIVCQDEGSSLKIAPDYRYFSTDPDNQGTWDPNYWRNPNNTTPYDYWKDDQRIARAFQGDTNSERITRWDWSVEDDDLSKPETYQFFGDYGASGAVGTYQDPYIQLGGGSDIYYKNDSGVFTFRNIAGDSTGCLDTISKRLFITRLDVAFNLGLEVPSCNSIIEFFDSSILHDPCNWAMKNCEGPIPMVCDFMNKWYIDWGDGADNYYERANNSQQGLPPRIAHKYTRNGWFKVRYSISTDQGCGDTFERWVLIPGPRPAFEFADKAGTTVTICAGDSIKFRNATDSAGPQSDWTWFFGDGGIANVKDSFITYTYNNAGVYEVYLEQFDSLIVPPNIRKYCPAVFPDTLSGQAKFVITVLPRDTVRGYIEKPIICPGDTNYFVDESDTILKVYKWQFEHYSAKTGQMVIDTLTTSDLRIGKAFRDPGVYKVTHLADYDDNHPRPWCPTLMAPLTFTVDSVVADFDIDSTNKPDFTFTRTDVNGTSWRWGFMHYEGDMDLQTELPRQFKQSSNSTNKKVTASYDTTGTYWVCLIAQNSSGCEDTICKPVYIDLFVNLANVFTPSGDGLNDEFRVPLQGHDVYEIRIFNRWGERVFFSEDPKVSWNGQINNDGPEAPSGTYFYQMQYRFKGKEKINRVNGTVNLIRPAK
jgi:gliding motility-associated-like protein